MEFKEFCKEINCPHYSTTRGDCLLTHEGECPATAAEFNKWMENNRIVMEKPKLKVFINTTQRKNCNDKLIFLLDNTKLVTLNSEEDKMKYLCDYYVHIISKDSISLLSIAKIIDFSNKYSNKLLILNLFDKTNSISIDQITQIVDILSSNGIKIFNTEQKVADFLNNI